MQLYTKVGLLHLLSWWNCCIIACTFCQQKRRITYKRTLRSLITFGWGDSLCNAWISRKLVTWSTSLLTSVILDDIPGMCGVCFSLWRFGCGSLAQEVNYKIIRVNNLHGCIIASVNYQSIGDPALGLHTIHLIVLYWEILWNNNLL